MHSLEPLASGFLLGSAMGTAHQQDVRGTEGGGGIYFLAPPLLGHSLGVAVIPTATAPVRWPHLWF